MNLTQEAIGRVQMLLEGIPTSTSKGASGHLWFSIVGVQTPCPSLDPNMELFDV